MYQSIALLSMQMSTGNDKQNENKTIKKIFKKKN